MSVRFHDVEKAYAVFERPQDRLWEMLTRHQRHRVHVALTGVNFAVQDAVVAMRRTSQVRVVGLLQPTGQLVVNVPGRV